MRNSGATSILTETIVVPKPSFRRVLSNKSFTLLWIGQLVSQSGDFIFDVAALWLVSGLPDAVFKVGLATATIILPGITVGPFAGVYVDKFNRRDVIILANIFQAIIVTGIAVLYSLGELPFVLLLVLLFLLNAGAQFVRPAVTAAIPHVTERSDLAAANGLFSISSSLNQVAGYGIGGILVLLLGIALPIYYDGLSFLVAAIAAGLIVRSSLALPERSKVTSQMSESFKTKFVEGLKYIRTNRFILEIIALATVLNFFAGGIQTLLAPYAKITLNGGVGVYGILLVGMSIGTVLGSLFIGKINSRNYVGKLLFFGVFTLAASIAGMGVTTSSPVAIGLMFTVGIALAIANLPIQVLVQAKVPGELLGRVLTTLVALITIASPVAAVITGSVATSFSISLTLLLYGSLMFLATAIGLVIFKDVRQAKY